MNGPISNGPYWVTPCPSSLHCTLHNLQQLAKSSIHAVFLIGVTLETSIFREATQSYTARTQLIRSRKLVTLLIDHMFHSKLAPCVENEESNLNYAVKPHPFLSAKYGSCLHIMYSRGVMNSEVWRNVSGVSFLLAFRPKINLDSCHHGRLFSIIRSQTHPY